MFEKSLTSLLSLFIIASTTDLAPQNNEKTEKSAPDLICIRGRQSETAKIFSLKAKKTLINAQGNIYKANGEIYGLKVSKEDTRNLPGYPRTIKTDYGSCTILYSDGLSSQQYPIQEQLGLDS